MSSVGTRNISSASSHSSRTSAANSQGLPQATPSRVCQTSAAAGRTTPRMLLPERASGSRMLFVGPDSSDVHKVACDRGKYVGFKPASEEISSDCEYLYRPSTGNEPKVLMRHQRVNEIGWNVQKLWKGYISK